ncbi:MAG: hypothetical protein V3T18_04710, partial [Pseudomonadales bacterium]
MATQTVTAESGQARPGRLQKLKDASALDIALIIYQSYIFRRFIFMLFVIWAASTIIFAIPRLSGQDPVKEKLLLEAQRGGALQTGFEAMAEAYQRRLGLDRPILTQYKSFMFDIVRFDLGPSIAFFPRSVN